MVHKPTEVHDQLAEHDPITDPHRLAAMRQTGMLDSPPDQEFDQLARLAAQVMEAPVALISFVDEDRQFFKSAVSTESHLQSERETALTLSLCRHAVAAKAALVLTDVQTDPKFRCHPAVLDGGIAAYAGLPIVLDDSYVLGTLCVIDWKPHDWRPDQLASLQTLVGHTALLVSDRISRNEAHARQAWLLRGHDDTRVPTDCLAAAIAFYLSRLDHYLAALRQTAAASEDAVHRGAVLAAKGNLWRALAAYDAESAAPGDLHHACAAFLAAEQTRDRVSLRFRRGEVPLHSLEQAVFVALASLEAVRVALRDYEIQNIS